MQNLILLEKAFQLLHVEDEGDVIKDSVTFEEDQKGRKYVGFSLYEGPRSHAFVFCFEDDEIVGDISGLFGINDILDFQSFAANFPKANEWIITEVALLRSYLLSAYETPIQSNALLLESAYVNKRLRKQGIFRMMIDILIEMVMHIMQNDQPLHTILSLDPDFACYGEDVLEQDYIYNKDKDEPLRNINKTIAEHCDFDVTEVVDEEDYNPHDGTRKWFAIRLDLPSSSHILN